MLWARRWQVQGFQSSSPIDPEMGVKPQQLRTQRHRGVLLLLPSHLVLNLTILLGPMGTVRLPVDWILLGACGGLDLTGTWGHQDQANQQHLPETSQHSAISVVWTHAWKTNQPCLPMLTPLQTKILRSRPRDQVQRLLSLHQR